MGKKVKPHAVPCVARPSAEQEPKSKTRSKYEPPKVVMFQEDEFLKQFENFWEICPPPACKK